jgi:hypothetical protein
MKMGGLRIYLPLFIIIIIRQLVDGVVEHPREEIQAQTMHSFWFWTPSKQAKRTQARKPPPKQV